MLTVVPDLPAALPADGRPSSLIDQIVREGARQMLAAALQAEVDDYIQRFSDVRDVNGHRMVVRNGSAEPRTVLTSAGAVEVTRAAGERQAHRPGDPVLVIDEVGYIPFEPEAASLFFQLVSARYERASLIVTSNKPFGRWGEVFGDDIVAAATIDRLVHHAEVIALKGDSYRLKDRDLGRAPAAATTEK